MTNHQSSKEIFFKKDDVPAVLAATSQSSEAGDELRDAITALVFEWYTWAYKQPRGKTISFWNDEKVMQLIAANNQQLIDRFTFIIGEDEYTEYANTNPHGSVWKTKEIEQNAWRNIMRAEQHQQLAKLKSEVINE